MVRRREGVRIRQGVDPITGRFVRGIIPYTKGTHRPIGVRAQISMKLKGNIPWNKGGTHSNEARAKIRTAAMGRIPWNKGIPCHAETRAKISAKRKGRVPGATTRMRMSAARRAHAGTPGCFCCVCGSFVSPTRLERILCEIILSEFPEVIPEKRFGPYRVDAYLPPPYHLAFEADGAYWHTKPDRRARDVRRDAYLLKERGLVVVRLSQTELLECAKGTPL